MESKDIALYLRLSLSDGDLGKDNKNESNSIENQRDLLTEYILNKGDLTGEVREYVDDGYTGTNFDRPGFQQMVKDAKAGKIGCILVKDLSRLGRDYIGAGDYIDKIFPMLGVRFIAVNNNYDSSRHCGDTMGLNLAVHNMVNSMYSRDLSKKIRSGHRVKWKQGLSTSNLVPFGYIINPEDSSKWIIDPVASQYVRKVFDYALAGSNTRQIANAMNEEGIPTPGSYGETINKYVQPSIMPAEERKWDPSKVRSILNRYEYTGALVMGKNEKVTFGSNKKRGVAKEDQIITEEAHEAIVSHEEFEEAQYAIKKINSQKYRALKEYPLRGLVRCGTCKRLMTYSSHNEEPCFYCKHKMDVGEFSECYDGYYRESSINTKILEAIRQVIRLAGFLEDEISKGEYQRKVELQIDDSQEKLNHQLEILKADRVRLYESYADGIISKEVYLNKKQVLSAEIEKIQTELDKINNSVDEAERIINGMQEISKQGRKHDSSLTNSMAREFIDNIYLYDGERMEIVFKCEDVFKKALDKYISDFNYNEETY